MANLGGGSRRRRWRKLRIAKRIVLRALARDDYSGWIKDYANRLPRTLEVLLSAEIGRRRRLRRYVQRRHLETLEALLTLLAEVQSLYEESPLLRSIYFLVRRVSEDYQVALEALLSGLLSVVSDLMRDVLETEMLIQDFALLPTQIEAWKRADDRTRLKRFAPAVLRQRRARSLGVDPAHLPGTEDYQAHSQLLHVNPQSLERGIYRAYSVDAVLRSLHDMWFHAKRVVTAYHQLALAVDATGVSNIDWQELTGQIDAALEQLDHVIGAARGVEIAIAKQIGLPADAVTLMEDGILMAVNRSKMEVTFFGVDMDFDLEYLESVYDQAMEHGAASFRLEPLGTSHLG
jgi:hypothetical protein